MHFVWGNRMRHDHGPGSEITATVGNHVNDAHHESVMVHAQGVFRLKTQPVSADRLTHSATTSMAFSVTRLLGPRTDLGIAVINTGESPSGKT